MLNFKTFFSDHFSLLTLLFHLGCFLFSSSHPPHPTTTSRLTKKLLSRPKTAFFSFLGRLFPPPPTTTVPRPPPSIPSPSSSTRSLHMPPTPELGAPIHPCTTCGEVLPTPALLDRHLSARHAVSEPADGERIVRIIFEMGWPDRAGKKKPDVRRVLKIHNGPKTTGRFEEYRELVKSRAAAAAAVDERCAADGNELLRFHCTTFICNLELGICTHNYCGVCGIVRSGFSSKMDGISMMSTSWGAHTSIPEDLEEEFSFMHVKRALLVCRVIAGRVGHEPDLGDKEDPGLDSLVGGSMDELLVFNPRAVLPCFVIEYTV